MITLDKTSYPLGPRNSIKIRDLGPNLELWQIGTDRLGEYTALFARIYAHHYSEYSERNRTDDELRAIYRRLHDHAVFMAAVKDGVIVTTGMALQAHGPNATPVLPEDIAPVLKPAEMARELQAPEAWFVTRMAINPDMVSPREGDLILRAVSGVTADIISGHPDNIMIGVLEEKLRRLYRRYGIHWQVLDELEMPIGNGLTMQRTFVRARDLAQARSGSAA